MCTFFWCYVLCPCPYEKDCALAINRIVYWTGQWRHRTGKQAPVPNSGTACERQKDMFGQDAEPSWGCSVRRLIDWMVELTFVIDSAPCAECSHKCKARFDKRMEEERQSREDGRREETVSYGAPSSEWRKKWKSEE
ncbi:hypothetical protein ACHAPE_002484 [Trichoderma viride]